MTTYNLENDISALLRSESSFSSRLPTARRLQRKALESSVLSHNGSFNVSVSNSLCKTPKPNSGNTSTVGGYSKTPGGKTPSAKTPGIKTPGKSKATPNKPKTPKTPNVGDRFIPNRCNTQFEIGNYLLNQGAANTENDEEQLNKNVELRNALSQCLTGRDIGNTKIISYATKAPPAPEGFQNELRVLYSHRAGPPSTHKTTRHIPQAPDRILDAPDIVDDYYLNLLDWSSTNILAVALSDRAFLWHAASGEIDLLLALEGAADIVTAVAFIEDGSYLAVGTSTGEVQLWDVVEKKRSRIMAGHSARVASLSWNHYILSSGSRSGAIHHHDVRVAAHLVGASTAHTQEVCGLKWSPDGRYLASGGNDNLIHIWACDANECYAEPTPLHVFSDHCSAVKALSWCPWLPSILASGGGSIDRSIRLWNCNLGQCLQVVDTKSQVCSILWSQEYKELISSHGYANNQLIIWKYPAMTKVTELRGHTERVLHLAMSPDGTTVVSASADETLRIWKCFAVDPVLAKNRKAALVSGSRGENVMMRQGIR